MHSKLQHPRHLGTSQNTRLLAALAPEAAPVDSRTEAELLVWAAGFGQAVHFFDRQNRIEGDWAPFFDSEPMVWHARISLQQMARREETLREQLHAWHRPVAPENAVLAEGNLLTLLYEQCQRINGWFVFFARRTEEHVFAAELRSAVELTFWQALETARQWEAVSGSEILARFRLQNDLSAFDAGLWRIGPGTEVSGDMADEAARRRRVRPLLWAACKAEARLVSAARARLQVLLEAPTRLAPHFALYLAFLRQLRLHAQTQLNALTGRHLDLFYRRILEEKPAPPVPDRVHVAFRIVPDAPPFHLAAGTRVVGKDAAGQPVVFALEEAVEMAGHSIAQLHTVITCPGPAGPRTLSSRVHPLAAEPWPMFGALAATAAPEVAPGFAVASPCLQLARGERQVTLGIRFQTGADAPQLKTGASGPQEEPAVEAVYSGPAGWVTPGGTGKLPPLSLALRRETAGEMVAEVVVTLSPEDPPCVRFDPKVLKGAFDPGGAVLKILRRNAAGLLPEDAVQGAFVWLLEHATVAGMTLDVGVSRAPADALANDLGVIPPGVPILPFGFAPAPRAALYVTYAEVKARPLQSLTLHLKWQNVPVDPVLYPAGFVDYYRDYAATLLRQRPDLGTRPFHSADYRVGVDSKAGDSWQPLADAVSSLALFQPVSDPEVLAPETELSFRFAEEPHAPGQVLPGDGGCIRVRLLEPGHAFGHSMYPQVLTDVALHNAETLMRMAQHDADSADQIFDRWKVPVKGGIVAFIMNQWMRYQWPQALYDMLPGQAATVLVLPEGISVAGVVKAMGGMAEKNGYLRRRHMDKDLLHGLHLNPKEDHNELLLAVYRWFDRLLRSVPSLLPLPPPPLTPALTAVTVSYHASLTVSFEAGAAVETTAAQCHQLLPAATPRMLRQDGLVAHLIAPTEAGGCLYVGLQNVAASQRVCLLFVLTDLRANAPGAEADAPAWSVLCSNGWAPLGPAEHTLKDETYGLQKSGRVQIVIPEDMDGQSPLMPPGLCWLRIHTRTPECFPEVAQILVQTGTGVRVLEAPAGSEPVAETTKEFSDAASAWRPLAADSLKALLPQDPRVRAVLQPLPSHGGRAGESGPQFLARVSERLRHKGRAWTAWDYERLLLQEFSGIFYARCLPHTRVPHAGGTGLADPSRVPGHVLVVVAPLLHQPPRVLPPVFATAELLEMEGWLRERASSVVKLRVCNPVYETVQISLRASFDGSQPLGAAQARLNRDLQEFLSPWIFRPASVPLPPFEFHLEDIRAFVKTRPYVKALRECGFGRGTQGAVDDERIRPSQPWSMLVTAAAHDFNPGTSP